MDGSLNRDRTAGTLPQEPNRKGVKISMKPKCSGPTYRGAVQAVILDWAGTAVDFGCMGPVAVFQEVFRQSGVEVSMGEARAPMGLMKKDHIRAICAMEPVAERWRSVHGTPPGDQDVDELYNRLQPLMVSALRRHCLPVPGLMEAVEAFRGQGLRIGSCTGYTGPMMEVLAAEAATHGYRPDSIVCATDVPAGRPYPWMCYLNAIRLQVYPLEAMVKIGDTVSDIQEGLNAGMWTIGVTRTGNELGLTEEEVGHLEPAELRSRLARIEERFRGAGAHFVAESIADCPPIIDEINRMIA